MKQTTKRVRVDYFRDGEHILWSSHKNIELAKKAAEANVAQSLRYGIIETYKITKA